MTMSNEINDYYSLKPQDFPILLSFEIKQMAPLFNEISLYLILSTREHSKTLHLYFEKVQNLVFSQPQVSSLEFFLDIREKNEFGLYRIVDNCEDALGFYCSFFAVTVV